MTDPAVVVDLAPTGVLRASINLGNPVLAQGTSEKPTGVTVDLAREVAARLGVPVSFACFDAARKSLAALIAGAADVAFLMMLPGCSGHQVRAAILATVIVEIRSTRAYWVDVVLELATL